LWYFSVAQIRAKRESPTMAISFDVLSQRNIPDETTALETLYRKGKAVSFFGQVQLQCLKIFRGEL